MNKFNTWGRSLGILLAAGAFAIGACAGELPRYSCEKLEGADLDGQQAFTGAINDSGDVVGLGFFARRLNVMTGAHWDAAGHVSYLFRSRRLHSGAYGINDAGQVVGFAQLRDGGDHPAVWVNGEPSPLPSLSGDELSVGNAVSINNEGQIVGFTDVGTGPQTHATLWDQGRAIDLGALDGGYSSFAAAINDHGVVAGVSDAPTGGRHAVRWTHGTIQDLGTLAGGFRSEATAISLRGVVVGHSDSAEHPYRLHAAVWRGGEVIDLGALPGDLMSEAHAISADGSVILGQSRADEGELARAVAWFGDSTAPVALDDLVVGGCRDGKGHLRSLTAASGVNARGDIAATAANYGPHGAFRVSAFKLKRL
ncbi:hypothetical protein AACH06_05620 [Ideonella sp. DXS29W]|uniref:HAF repeat-containing protein n=1 Tax=Ideonella lacteola TaxID=2984193 RepID=A0ABU9BK07_9BURK